MSGNCWVNTNVTPNSACVFYSKFVPLIETKNIDWATWWGSNTSDDNANTYQLRRNGATDAWKPQVGNSWRTGSVDTILWGMTNEVTMDMVNLSATINGNSYTASQCKWNNYADSTVPIFVGANNKNGSPFRTANASWSRFSITKEGVLAIDLIPVINENDEVCFYDNVSGNYFYAAGTGEMIAGPQTGQIVATASETLIGNSGGVITINVSSENPWTLSASSTNFLAFSTESGSGIGYLTASADSYYQSVDRSVVLTFTDTVTQNTCQLTITQEKYGSGGVPVYVGGTAIDTLYFGTLNVPAAYLGEILVFSKGVLPLEIIPSSLYFYNDAATQECTIVSNEPWTMTVPSWITASTLTGGTGGTVVTFTSDTGSTSVSGSVIVSSSSHIARAYCEYNYRDYQPVDYIWEDSTGYDRTHCLNTGIEHNDVNTYVEIKYIARGSNSDRMVGYQPGDSGCTGDDADYRIFGFQNGTFDYANGRSSTSKVLNIVDEEYDIIIGRGTCFDNTTQTLIANLPYGDTVPSPGCPIYVDVSLIKVKEVKIVIGTTVLFDGIAAYKNGEYGLYDLVSQQLITNSNISIIGPQ